jgi:hypothetical protein
MPNKQNKNFNFYTPTQKKVLDLEKKYFNIFYQIFSQSSFQKELQSIMTDINQNWQKIHGIWGKTNVVDLALERHINFRIYNDKSIRNQIVSVYPSVISSDTAFITNDAVINIDSKTISVDENHTDWDRQTLGKNQMSFDNKLNFIAPRKKIPVPISSHLQPFHNSKPVLSFFLSALYHIDEQNRNDSWYIDSAHKIKPYYDKKIKDKTVVKQEFLKNIKFACMPHHELSNLFNFDIIAGVKSYIPPDNPNPTGTASTRVDHENLRDRYDSSGKAWEGFKSWVI